VPFLCLLLAACGGGPLAESDLFGADVTSTSPLEREQAEGGLFGFAAAAERAASGPVASLPFGEVAKVCGLSKREMGTEVARSPGKTGFTLYDTDPSSIEPRPQFLTGFRDGCARQITASLALFGTAQVHETTRYNPLNSTAYSATDAAYEKIKNRVCGVGDGEFCPERKAKRMDRNAVFLSVYRDFGGAGQWMELFLHNRRLVAHATLGG
jgi:hypothetical protein